MSHLGDFLKFPIGCQCFKFCDSKTRKAREKSGPQTRKDNTINRCILLISNYDNKGWAEKNERDMKVSSKYTKQQSNHELRE
jgi:hypothetical protein